MNVRDTLLKIAQNYKSAKQEPLKGHPLAGFIRGDACESFANALAGMHDNIKIVGSPGRTLWSDVPWIAFMNPLVTKTTQREYYVVYLFSADGKEVYLCLGQGVRAVRTEFARQCAKVLKQRAELIRTRLPDYKKYFLDKPFDTKGKSRLSKDYGDAPAFYKKYHTNSLPDNEQLTADLYLMLDFYDELFLLGGTDISEFSESEEELGKALTVTEKKMFSVHKRVEGRANVNSVKKLQGYICKVCGFDFQEKYGALGEKYIEAHHLIPYSELDVGKIRNLDIKNDFVVLCANCHRMAHRMEQPDDIDGLRKIVLEGDSNGH